MSQPRFEDVTETTGVPISAEGASMLYTRYHLAAELAAGQRVLEIGCAAGQGLGLIGAAARMVVGGDYSAPLLRSAHRHYGSRIPLVRLSAERLPFADASFDLVLFFEASYYVPDMDSAFREIGRVLAPSGSVLFVNANPERPDFIRSPFSVHYHSADEFRAALARAGMTVEVKGAFPTEEPGAGLVSKLKGNVFSVARRVLEFFHLVPRTLRGRARLKRLISRRLQEVPAELEPGFATAVTPEVVEPGAVTGYKVIYVEGRNGTTN